MIAGSLRRRRTRVVAVVAATATAILTVTVVAAAVLTESEGASPSEQQAAQPSRKLLGSMHRETDLATPVTTTPSTTTPSTTTPATTPAPLCPPGSVPYDGGCEGQEPVDGLPNPLQGQVVSFGGVGNAVVGMTVGQVEQTLGLDLSERVEVDGGCVVHQDRLAGVAVLLDGPDAVQVFIVWAPLPLVEATGTPVAVGDPIEAVTEAWPAWTGGSDSQSMYGGRFAWVLPPHRDGFQRRSASFGADEDGVIREIRVGEHLYANHVNYCTTP